VIPIAAAMLAVLASGCASTPKSSGPRSPLESLTKEARRDMIRRAQVWSPTDIPTLDIKAGPQGKGAFAPGETVTCEHTEEKSSGKSPKFYCKVGGDKKDDELKVKYGASNGEVYAEVVATRLLWALGFAADRMYPVRVVCKGCSADPFHDPVPAPSPPTFDPATVERKLPGKTLESKPDSGWKWPELDLVDESAGGAPKAHRDALKLLAVMIKHTDSKPPQQRLICAQGAADEERGTCAKPVMMINDLGVTFGKPIITNSNSKGSLNYENWSSTRIWKDPDACVADLKKSFTGSLSHPRISEAGRRFLADLLVQLSDQQINDLFEVARVERRRPKPGQDWPQPHPAADWALAFKKKRDEIVHHSCPE
jgi:hypothetical protein